MTCVDTGVDDKKVAFEQSKPTVKTSVSLDCSKAKLVLGWQPKVSLEAGIKKLSYGIREIKLKILRERTFDNY